MFLERCVISKVIHLPYKIITWSMLFLGHAFLNFKNFLGNEWQHKSDWTWTQEWFGESGDGHISEVEQSEYKIAFMKIIKIVVRNFEYNTIVLNYANQSIFGRLFMSYKDYSWNILWRWFLRDG